MDGFINSCRFRPDCGHGPNRLGVEGQTVVHFVFSHLDRSIGGGGGEGGGKAERNKEKKKTSATSAGCPAERMLDAFKVNRGHVVVLRWHLTRLTQFRCVPRPIQVKFKVNRGQHQVTWHFQSIQHPINRSSRLITRLGPLKRNQFRNGSAATAWNVNPWMNGRMEALDQSALGT